MGSLERSMEYHGYLPNTSDDRSGLVVVFAAVGLCWSLTVLVARLAGSLSRRRAVGWEDGGIIASTTFGIASSTAIFLAVKYSFGRRHGLQAPNDAAGDEEALYAADILYILALTFSKLAILQLILGLRPIPLHQRFCRGAEILTVLWAVAGVVTIAIRCNSSHPWRSYAAAQCSDLFTRWVALEVISLLIEFIIFGIAVAMIWMLQMPREKKLSAMVAFAIRLPIIIPTAFRLYYLNIAFHSTDYAFAAVSVVIATQCNMHYSIMSASLSYLKPFLAAFDSNFGASTKLETIVATRSSGRRGESNTGGGGSSGHWRSRNDTRQATATPGPGEAPMVRREGSEDSEAPIILKTTTYRVDVEQ